MGERAIFFKDLLLASEMYCSLRYEDMGGCPYDTFTPRGIAALSSAIGFLSLISLLAGT